MWKWKKSKKNDTHHIFFFSLCVCLCVVCWQKPAGPVATTSATATGMLCICYVKVNKKIEEWHSLHFSSSPSVFVLFDNGLQSLVSATNKTTMNDCVRVNAILNEKETLFANHWHSFRLALLRQALRLLWLQMSLVQSERNRVRVSSSWIDVGRNRGTYPSKPTVHFSCSAISQPLTFSLFFVCDLSASGSLFCKSFLFVCLFVKFLLRMCITLLRQCLRF